MIVKESDFDFLISELKAAWEREKIAIEALEKIIKDSAENPMDLIAQYDFIACEAIVKIRQSKKMK